MRATEHLLAGDSWIALSNGAKHVRDLESGDTLVVVRPDGTIGPVRVSSVGYGIAGESCISFAVAVGEIILPGSSHITTRAGIERADRLEAAVRSGQAVRIEVVRPNDLFSAIEKSTNIKDAYQAALAAFPRTHITIPGWLESLSTICSEIEEILSIAGVSYKRARAGEWLVFSFDKSTSEFTGMTWTKPAAQSRALRVMTAWSGGGSELVSRILLHEVSLLQHLTGCLAAAGQECDVRWVPGYRPVEIHVSPRTGLARSHVPVTQTLSRIQDCFRVSVEGDGSLIVGLALMA
jgi:hypothetical protein